MAANATKKERILMLTFSYFFFTNTSNFSGISLQFSMISGKSAFRKKKKFTFLENKLLVSSETCYGTSEILYQDPGKSRCGNTHEKYCNTKQTRCGIPEFSKWFVDCINNPSVQQFSRFGSIMIIPTIIKWAQKKNYENSWVAKFPAQSLWCGSLRISSYRKGVISRMVQIFI